MADTEDTARDMAVMSPEEYAALMIRVGQALLASGILAPRPESGHDAPVLGSPIVVDLIMHNLSKERS